MKSPLKPYVIIVCLLLSLCSLGHSEILGGWDASIPSQNNGLRFTGQGTKAYPNDSYIYGTIAGKKVETTFKPGIGSTALTGLNGAEVEVTFRIDLDGSKALLFEEFWVSMQRSGDLNKGANTVKEASFSTDHFATPGHSLLVREVSKGHPKGTKDVGPYHNILTFRKPNGFGGGIHPQQTYQLSGLESAGALNSGSLWIRYTVSKSDAGKTAHFMTLINDRYDLSTTAIAQAKENHIDDPTNGIVDGYDVLWTGKKVSIPEPAISGIAVGVLSFAALGFQRRKKAHN
ncbi:MAG: hypothetical protein ACSHX8_04105 [Opitutaceae bacterium]